MNSLQLFGIRRHLIALCIISASALGEESSADGMQLHLTATSHRNASGAWSVSTFASGDVVAAQPPRIHVDAKLNVGNRPHGWVTWLTANATVLVGNDAPGVPPNSPSRATQAPVTTSTAAPTTKIFSTSPSISRTTQAPATTSTVAPTTKMVPNRQATQESSDEITLYDGYYDDDNNVFPLASSNTNVSVVHVTVNPPKLVSANLVTALAGYESFNIPGVTSLYRLQTRALPWPEARAVCEAEGAHLIVVNSEAEAQVVKEFFDRQPYLVDAENPLWFAVGLHKQGGRDLTVLGGTLETSGYAKWAPLDGQWIQGPKVDCGIMDRRLFFAYEYCGYKRAFICELEQNVVLF